MPPFTRTGRFPPDTLHYPHPYPHPYPWRGKKPFPTCSASNVRVVRATEGMSAAITLSLSRTMLSPDVTHFITVTGFLKHALITQRAT